jgi:hypothetical protein
MRPIEWAAGRSNVEAPHTFGTVVLSTGYDTVAFHFSPLETVALHCLGFEHYLADTRQFGLDARQHSAQLVYSLVLALSAFPKRISHIRTILAMQAICLFPCS